MHEFPIDVGTSSALVLTARWWFARRQWRPGTILAPIYRRCTCKISGKRPLIFSNELSLPASERLILFERSILCLQRGACPKNSCIIPCASTASAQDDTAGCCCPKPHVNDSHARVCTSLIVPLTPYCVIRTVPTFSLRCYINGEAHWISLQNNQSASEAPRAIMRLLNTFL